MDKKKKRVFRLLLLFLGVLVVSCGIGYFGFCYWINSSGSLVMATDEVDMDSMDQGSAVVVSGANRKDGVFTLFIGATDEDETRTDSMMVLVFDTVHHKAGIINIPRDTLVDCNRTGAARKINAAYASGIDEMLDEVADVIGFRPDKYLVANFDAIEEIVDTLGGIDYEIPFDMSYHDEMQDLSIEFEAGMQHLDGKQTVEFLRWRHNDDGTGYENGDLGRVEKLQTFLKALGKKMLSPVNILKIPSLAKCVFDNVETDLTSAQILWVGMQALHVDMDSGIETQTLYGDEAIVDLGTEIWFFIADEDMIRDQINEYFNPYTYDLTEEDFNIITPEYFGIYSQSWHDEKACRYAMYEEQEQEQDGSASDADNTDTLGVDAKHNYEDDGADDNQEYFDDD